MSLQNILGILGIFFLSAVKFGIAGVPAAVFSHYSFFKAIAVTVSGGITGTIIFTYLSVWILKTFEKLKEKYFPESPNKKVKRKFTKVNRTIVYVKKRFGLIGLSIITPLLLSIPLGSFLAVKYYHNKQKIILYMSVSILIWAFILYFFFNMFYASFSEHFS